MAHLLASAAALLATAADAADAAPTPTAASGWGLWTARDNKPGSAPPPPQAPPPLRPLSLADDPRSNDADRLSAPAAAQRETLNFDYAWRFQRAVEPRYQQCTFDANVTYGEGEIWYGETATKEECCNECVNRETCRSWYWNGRWCVVKDNSVGTKPAPGRWSGRLGPPWPANATSPARAAKDFDDSGWEVVDAPHDYGRKRMLNCQNTGRRRLAQIDEPDFVNNCSKLPSGLHSSQDRSDIVADRRLVSEAL